MMYAEVDTEEKKIWVYKSTRDPLAVLELDKSGAESLVSDLKDSIEELVEACEYELLEDAPIGNILCKKCKGVKREMGWHHV